MRLPKFKTAGTILINPTVEQFLTTAAEVYGEGWGDEHEQSARDAYAKMNDGTTARATLANDRMSLQWKPIDDEAGNYCGKAVNFFPEPLLESDRVI